MKLYAVIDTNVLVSSLLSVRENSPVVLVWDSILNGDIIPMFNEDILTEYEQVLSREKFHINKEIIKDILAVINIRGIFCTPIKTDLVISDPDDRVFFEIMLSRSDAYLITGNKKHFPQFERVISPAEAVYIIQSQESDNKFLNEP